jgi:hypothetical protein
VCGASEADTGICPLTEEDADVDLWEEDNCLATTVYLEAVSHAVSHG